MIPWARDGGGAGPYPHTPLGVLGSWVMGVELLHEELMKSKHFLPTAFACRKVTKICSQQITMSEKKNFNRLLEKKPG